MSNSGPDYNKLKTNLWLAVNGLKLLEKKKTELVTKSRKEISDFFWLADITRIRVEHIIKDEYLVKAMEILEIFCDLLLARFELVTQHKELDEGISEAVCSIIWVAPRLQADVAELKIVSDLLQTKYGKHFANACRASVPPASVSEKLQHKMSIQAPPKLLVEKYLIEIAKTYNIEYEPDPQIMKDDQKASTGSDFLIDLNNPNNLGGIVTQPGFIGYPQPPALPIMPQPPSNIPLKCPPGPSGVRQQQNRIIIQQPNNSQSFIVQTTTGQQVINVQNSGQQVSRIPQKVVQVQQPQLQQFREMEQQQPEQQLQIQEPEVQRISTLKDSPGSQNAVVPSSSGTSGTGINIDEYRKRNMQPFNEPQQQKKKICVVKPIVNNYIGLRQQQRQLQHQLQRPQPRPKMALKVRGTSIAYLKPGPQYSTIAQQLQLQQQQEQQRAHGSIALKETEVNECESAKMLVILDNGEQKLITFTFPKETCTVHELLDQVGIILELDSPIECIENSGKEIDYIVKVGHFRARTDIAAMTKAAENHVRQQQHQKQLQLQ